MAEDDGIAAAFDEDFFDALGQTDDRRFAASLADDRQGRMELAFAAVDDDQVRHGPILFAIAPFHDFRHGLKVIRLALDGLQFEAAILFLSRLTVLEDDHRGHGLYPLGMGNIEALHALRQAGQIEDARQAFDGTGRLVYVVLPLQAFLFQQAGCIFGSHVQELFLRPPLGNDDGHFPALLLAQAAFASVQVFQGRHDDF